jgi:hypothetical protein
MKSTIQACCVIVVGSILPLPADQTTTEKTEVTKSAAGVTQTTTTTTTTFNPETQTKVVTYFDAYKGNPHGLPPGWVAKVKVKEVPVAWRTTRIAPGVVVTETQRPYLIDAPPELIKVLPAPVAGVRYYVAGSNVVAVDSSYKIVDSVRIPTIKYGEDDGEVEIQSGKNGGKTKIEVDEDHGEVEIKKDDD